MLRIMHRFFWAVLICGIAMASCQKGSSDQSPKYPYDDSEFLLNQVLYLGDNGAIEGTYGGLQLDESDPGKITIAAENYNEAKEWFNLLIPPEAEIITNGESVIWNLQDTLGVKKGQAVLQPVKDAKDGRIAEIEVPASARPLSSIVFMPKDVIAMSMNDETFSHKDFVDVLDNFYQGAKITLKPGVALPEGAYMVRKDSFERGDGDFLVIQEYTQANKDGILLRLNPGEKHWMTSNTDSDFSQASLHWTLCYVHNILDANPALHAVIKQMGMPDWNRGFMCKKTNTDSNHYRCNLSNPGSIVRMGHFSEYLHYYECFVYRFWVGDVNGVYKVWIEPADRGYNAHQS